MIVTREAFPEIVARFSATGRYGFDTETTGLRPWQGDQLFSVILSDSQGAAYFDFNGTLPRAWIKKLQPIFANVESLFFVSKAKFDMAFMHTEGVSILGTVHCTEAIGRVEKNNRFAYGYGLDALGKEIGFPKSTAVEGYIKEHKLYDEELNAKGEKVKKPLYSKVPLNVMAPYALSDATIVRAIGEHQITRILDMQAKNPVGKAGPVDIMRQERDLTKVFFRMEEFGVRVDLGYCQKGFDYERRRMANAKATWRQMTGTDFVDSAKCFAPAFDKAGELYPKTEKGNPSFKAEILEEFSSPLAKLILEYRDAAKRANTYFFNLLRYADKNGRVHADAKQGGTETGRVSYADPNFQNLHKRDSSDYPVRRAVIPEDECFLLMKDYDQVEYRLMIIYARQDDIIDQVRNGLDVHTATANLMGVQRDQAKTLNFMLLYGGGVAKLCVALFKPVYPLPVLRELVRVHLWRKPAENAALLVGLNPETVKHDVEELKKALDLREQYFSKLPKVQQFVKGVIDAGKSRGYVRNWAGRICRIANPEWAYVLPNHLIQGGCADVMKKAMIQVDELLRREKAKTRITIQVHDELLFQMHRKELHLAQAIDEIMVKAYPNDILPLTVGTEHSFKSWFDKEEGLPNG